jgi:signal transduction histidine kinase
MLVLDRLPPLSPGTLAIIDATALIIFLLPIFYYFLLQPIVERREAEEKLKKANLELDAFVCTVSHDLRAPLTSLIGFADFLHENCQAKLGEQELECLSEISASGHRMMALIEDLLTLAKVGKIMRPTDPIDPGIVVNEVLFDLSKDLTETGIAVEVGDLPSLRVPKTLLTQMFLNLISNANQYAGKKVSLIEVGGERRGNEVRFYVRDHGPGIPKEERNRIFEAFYRGPAKSEPSGSGVGLATVQKIAKTYGGRAWVEETEGGGSTFWVEMMDVSSADEKGKSVL